MAFTSKDFTITINPSTIDPVVITGWDMGTGISIPKPKKIPHARDAIKVAGRSFSEYIGRRLLKDGVGFIPIAEEKEACTDRKTYIKSAIPLTAATFLIYAHELGHCKSFQPELESSFGWGGTCNGTLNREFNAWVWGMRYFRRLGFKINEECISIIQHSLESYFINSNDREYAKVLSEKFYNKFGVRTQVPEKTKNGGYFMTSKPTTISWDFGPKIKPKCFEVITEKPKGWKPWHDLKQKQMKKQWKHCK